MKNIEKSQTIKSTAANVGRPSTFSPEFKLMVAIIAYTGTKSFESIAREFDVSHMSVRKWKRMLHQKGQTLFGGEEQTEIEPTTTKDVIVSRKTKESYSYFGDIRNIITAILCGSLFLLGLIIGLLN